MYRKLMLLLLLPAVLLFSACGQNNDSKSESTAPKTVTYQSENGPVEVPAHPKRVIVLSTFTGDVLKLGVPLVGVDSYAKDNPNFKEALKGVEAVSENDIEKIIALKPDLIIGLSTTKNIDKLKKIAPTVTYTYGKLDYLNQFIEIGKLLNKEKQAKAWVADYKKRAEALGKEIKAKIGEDATVSVIENSGKQLYVFGNNWARGTEPLYQEMKLNMPKAVKRDALKPGWFAISPEVLPEYCGDYVIFSKDPNADASFMTTDTYKNIPAVKNGHVYTVNAKAFYFNDPISLEYQLDFFKKAFLGE
ncbi:iron-hydroxamate ABC transporter substrate-binding protein [Tuberibacillus calidus]|jgi:iron complex transport system substrate-binding protein|uniref:iron-hydroxamate ABC transporter substrate-binding protein n=1 Tax=Tuberibacillus calidus TaxID=340097 RepID=UPI0004079D39|nr:iron-hydroxamate ABC transporter substrate-binding protein [Tuberibacillus calidus]